MSQRDPLTLMQILYEVGYERNRQDAARDAGRFAWTCADEGPANAERYVILSREAHDEVGRAMGRLARAVAVSADRRPELAEAAAHLRAELVQVAAVAVSWVEFIDRHPLVDTPVSTVVESPQLNERR